MKILFLDIDGVIVLLGRSFHAPALAELRRIVAETGCRLVLSSTWRRYPASVAHLEQTFEVFGLPGFSGKTPIMDTRVRAEEIEEWLVCHPRVTRYAIVDDESGAMIEGHGFKTETRVGLTKEIADRIIEHLNRED